MSKYRIVKGANGKEQEVRNRETCGLCGKASFFRLCDVEYRHGESLKNGIREGRYFCIYCRFASSPIICKVKNDVLLLTRKYE